MARDDLQELFNQGKKETPSFVEPSWGGPFIWVKNAAGRLTLQKKPVLKEKGNT